MLLQVLLESPRAIARADYLCNEKVCRASGVQGLTLKKNVWEKYLPTHFVVLVILLFFVLFSLEKAVTGTMYKLQFDFSFTGGQVTKCHI